MGIKTPELGVKNTPIQGGYVIKTNPETSENPQAKCIIETIHWIIANLVQMYNLQGNYVDENNPSMVILSAKAFEVCSMFHTTKVTTPGQLVVKRDAIIPISYISGLK